MKTEKRNTLMKRIIRYFLIVIFCMALLNAFSSYTFRSFYGNAYTALTRLGDIYTISVKSGTLLKSVDSYVYSGSKSDLESYNKEYSSLNALAAHLRNDAAGDEYYEYGDLQNMISSFNDDSKALIKAYDTKAQPTYISATVEELTKLNGYIEDEVKNLLLSQLGSTMAYYEEFFNSAVRMENYTYLVIILITALCIGIAIRFSREISRPIHKLVQNLGKVAKGEFETESVQVKTNDEIKDLIESYDYMTVKLKGLIEEIKVKADIEKKLTEEQIKNLEMTNLLSQSELKFLQSQINPHFLYNTLNSISALALIEGAEQTRRMLGCISDILKYYLKKINENVTLLEEFRIVENYLYIQKARFGDRIEYRLNCDEGVMGYSVPSMILQPFVENAIIHGLEPKEEKGWLQVDISDQGKYILIAVEDNGIGMKEETLEHLMNKIGTGANPAEGIGVSNVIRRLDLKYGNRVVDIRSTWRKGTEVRIELPKAI